MCMYVCIDVLMYVCIDVCMHGCMHTYIHQSSIHAFITNRYDILDKTVNINILALSKSNVFRWRARDFNFPNTKYNRMVT